MTSWGLAHPGETAPPKVSYFLEIVNNLPAQYTFHIKTNQLKVYPQRRLTLTRQAIICPAINHHRARYHITADYPYGSEPSDWFKLSNSRLTQTGLRCLTHAFPVETITELLGHALLSLLPLDPPDVSSCDPAWHGMLPALENCNKLFFQGSHLHVCHLTIPD